MRLNRRAFSLIELLAAMSSLDRYEFDLKGDNVKILAVARVNI
jgi:hypothetical protein